MIKKTTDQIYKELSAPFTITASDGKVYDAHKWRVFRFENKKGVCLPYLSANLVIKRLNEVIGLDGWSETKEEMSGEGMISQLTLLINGKEVTRSNVGVKSKEAAEKGRASDSFKRAAVMFEIGTYLNNIEPVLVDIAVVNGKRKPCLPNGKPLSSDELTSYINMKHPLRSKLEEIYRSFDKNKRKKLDSAFNKINKALNK